MGANLKTVAIVVALTLSISGCKVNPAIDELFGGKPNTRSSDKQQASGIAQPQEGKPTQLIVPSDKAVAVAMNEALPIIKKVLGIHQCLNDSAGLRQMNFYAVPGTDITAGRVNPYGRLVGLPMNMEYHDKNKCLSVQTLDQWSMPALNALQFRAVYFADDSGETVNFLYLFKKVDDGSWKVAQFEKQQ